MNKNKKPGVRAGKNVTEVFQSPRNIVYMLELSILKEKTRC